MINIKQNISHIKLIITQYQSIMLEYRAILYNICGMIAPSCAYLSLLTIFFYKRKERLFSYFD